MHQINNNSCKKPIQTFHPRRGVQDVVWREGAICPSKRRRPVSQPHPRHMHPAMFCNLVVASKTRSGGKGAICPSTRRRPVSQPHPRPMHAAMFSALAVASKARSGGSKTQTINTIHCTCTKLTIINAKTHTNLPPRPRRGLEEVKHKQLTQYTAHAPS